MCIVYLYCYGSINLERSQRDDLSKGLLMANTASNQNLTEINQSIFQPYSVGIVAQNKELNSNWIEATPVEDAMILAGELTDHVYQYQSSGLDADKKPYQTNVKTSATIKCKWLASSQSNRMTAPDVRRGEKVMIYRVANSTMFYWDTMVNNSNTRRLETVVHAYSGTQKEDEQLNEQNSYVTEVSTHKKLVRLIHTSQANGEHFVYDIYVDTGNDFIMLKDNVGNFITLNSAKHQIHLKNKDQSEVELIQRVINIRSPDTINIKTTTLNIETTTINSKGKWNQQGNVDIVGYCNPTAGGTTPADFVAAGISLNSHNHVKNPGRPT